MHLHWEQSHNTAGDCNIRSLSWMGRVPDEIPQVRNLVCLFFYCLHSEGKGVAHNSATLSHVRPGLASAHRV